MSDRLYFRLVHAEARRRAAQACQSVPDGHIVTVAEPSRTLAENALLHAIISEVAERIEWAGKKRDTETWKRLLVAAWCRVRGEHIEILPALDGNGIDIIPARTSKLTKKECADLIEFIYAWGVENGIIWTQK